MNPARLTSLFARWESLFSPEGFCPAAFLRAVLMGHGEGLGVLLEGEAWIWEGEAYRGVMDPSKAYGLEELLALYGGGLEEALQGLVKRQGPWAWIPVALEGRVWAFLRGKPPSDPDWTLEEVALALHLFLRQGLRRVQEGGRAQVLSQAWEVFQAVDSPQVLYRRVVEVTQHHLQASRSSFGEASTTVILALYRPEQDALEVVAGAGRRAAVALGRRLRRGEGVSWKVLDAGKPLYIPDVLSEPQAVFFVGDPEPAAYFGVPLKDGEGRVIGVLSADTAGVGGEILPEERVWLQTMAQVAGVHLARLLALEEARRQAENYKALLELSASLEALQDPLTMAERALGVLLRLTAYEAGALYRLEGERFRPVVLSGDYPEAFVRLYDLYPVRLGEGVLGRALALGRPFYVEDYARFPHAIPPYVQSGLRSAMLMPLVLAQGKGKELLWGVLAVGSFKTCIPYRREDEALLFAVSGRMVKALERALYQEELRRTRNAVLEALGRVLEGRDLETKGHTDRVVDLALRLGERVGFPDLEALRLGAFLHDLGKLALPDCILLKPTPLSSEEWQVVRTHPELGYEMLKELGFLPEAALNVVLYHHERFDGSGYPRGLRGEEIPLEARIFAVADVWDALLSERPYKAAWPLEKAKEELRAQAGQGLDPRLVEAFLALV